jgi:hypothetical protein
MNDDWAMRQESSSAQSLEVIRMRDALDRIRGIAVMQYQVAQDYWWAEVDRIALIALGEKP